MVFAHAVSWSTTTCGIIFFSVFFVAMVFQALRECFGWPDYQNNKKPGKGNDEMNGSGKRGIDD
jgi:hypothetical protein